MRQERIKSENVDPDYGKVRYGAIRDVAAQARNHAQNVAITAEIDDSREKCRPEALQLEARAFQLELYMRAKTQNTIAVLDTGAGKTFIAALLIKDTLYKEIYADQNLTNSHKSATSNDHNHRLIFFVVDKVALAFQQAEFLQKTVPGRIGLLYGALGVDNFSKQQWNDVFCRNDVVVLTADILKDCLARGLLQMQAGNHAFAMIQQFYHACDPRHRPKIFGMTASPIGSKRRPEQVASELERILDATICTPHPDSIVSYFFVRPKEYFCFYEKSFAEPIEIRMMDNLKNLLNGNKSLVRSLKNVEEAGQHLGVWASRILLKLLLEDILWRIRAHAPVSHISSVSDEHHSAKLIEEMLADCIYPKVEDVQASMTAKVGQLLALLRNIIDDVARAPVVLVFCERRTTAYLLMVLCNTILKETLPRDMKCSLFIGHGSSDEGDISMPVQRQGLVVDHFRRGEVNCLFATSVAEEGIDIPACEYVVRFDPLTSVTQYIQSRGRARKPGSSYVTLMERDDHKAIANHTQIKDSETVVRKICSTLDRDRYVLLDQDFEGTTRDENNLDSGLSSQTQVLPNFAAISVIEDFCRSLPTDEFISSMPYFQIQPIGNAGFVATCHFPPVSEIQPVQGSLQKSKRSAKADAAQIAVCELKLRGLLDEVYRPKKPLSEPAEDGEEVEKEFLNSNYPRRWPTFWKHGLAEHFFVTRVSTDKRGSDFAPMLLITKDRPLPVLPALPFWHCNESFTIATENLIGHLPASAIDIEILHGFTDRLLRVMVNKTFATTVQDQPYFLAIDKGSDDVTQVIDWSEMRSSYYDRHDIITEEMLRSGLPGAIVKDLTRHTYYLVSEVCAEMTPDSILPEDDRRWQKASLAGKSKIKDVCFLADQDLLLTDPLLPIIKAIQLKRTLNYLSPRYPADQTFNNSDAEKGRFTYLLPQTCALVNMRGAVVSTALLFPSFSLRLDSFLNAAELNSQLQSNIDLPVLVSALTAKQSQYGCDYERLEYLGDAFLKLITTVAVYIHFPNYHEGLLTMHRTAILENKNLKKLALKLKL